MKYLTKHITVLAIFFGTYVSPSFADSNCFDRGQFPTIATQCSCLLTNAVTDCTAHVTPAEQKACTAKFMDNLFKQHSTQAIDVCQAYGGQPSVCEESITFYDQNCPSPGYQLNS